MGYAQTRKKYGYPDTLSDRDVVLQTRARPEFAHVTDEDFASGIDQYEGGAGASQPSAPGMPRQGQSAASAPATPMTPMQGLGVLAKAGGQEFADFGRAAVEAPVMFAKSLINIPKGLYYNPIKQIAQGNRPATPEEEAETRSGLGGLVGTMIPGPLGKVLGKTPLPGRAVSALAGAGAGLADAGISSGGNPTQTAAGGSVAALLGALLHRPAGLPQGIANEPNPVWSAGLENDVPTSQRIGGGIPSRQKAALAKKASALEGLYGGAHEAEAAQPPAPIGPRSPRTLPLKDAMGELMAKIKAMEDGDLKVELMPTEDALHIVSVEGSNPIKSGRAMMRAVKLADEYGVPLSGEDRPLAGGQVSNLDLRALYEKAGGKPVSPGSPYMRREPKGGSGGFARAYPKEFEAVLRGEMEPGEAIHKATGQGVLIDEDTLDMMRRQLEKEVAQAGGTPSPPQMGGFPGTAMPQGVKPSKMAAPKTRALQGLYGATPPKPPRGGTLPAPVPPLPNNLTSKVARGPLGPLISSVTDRMRAMGAPGQAIDDMIEQVARAQQREPGRYLQPFDQALHAVTGKKGSLSPAHRSMLLGALQRKVNPQTLPPELLPLYKQMKFYFGGTVGRATQVGAMVNKGGKRIPFAQAAINDYFPHRAVKLSDMKGNTDARTAMAQNLMDEGHAQTPADAIKLIDDYALLLESKGKRGGQLAMGVLSKLNPNKTPAELSRALFNAKPPIRRPASGLEHSREINNPFYEARPEVAFPAHVQETERALAEIQHYGQDAKKLTDQVKLLSGEHQPEAEHLIRTATESHEPWDPRIAEPLSLLRKAQLSLFTPITTVKNLGQRQNNLLTSDLPSFLKKGVIPTKSSAVLGARSGARAEGAHETLAQALGDSPGVMAKWLKGIGFTQAERGNRNTGAATGLDEAAKYAKRLGKNPNDPLARYRLEREGIDPNQVTGGTLTQRQEDMAALQRSNKAQFRTHPKDLPDWFTSNPATRTAALFKSFDYQQTRLVLDETLGRLSSGKPGDKARGARNLGLILTTYPVIGEGINDIYSVILRKESPAHVAQRTKEWAEDTKAVLSGGMSPLAYANKYKARYGQDMISGSAPGVGGSLVQAMDYGKGDKGATLMREAAGPAISRPYEAIQLGKDVLTQKDKKGKEKPMTPAQSREAMRLMFGGVGSVAAPWLYPPPNAAGKNQN